MPNAKRLYEQAARAGVDGPFQEDDDEMGIEPKVMAQTLNYWYAAAQGQMNKASRDNYLRSLRMFIAVGFVSGVLITYLCIFVFFHPIRKSLDGLTAELREASSSKALLEILKDRK